MNTVAAKNPSAMAIKGASAYRVAMKNSHSASATCWAMVLRMWGW